MHAEETAIHIASDEPGLARPGPAVRRPLPGAANPEGPGGGERWRIWRLQIAAGHEPCFGTPERFGCDVLDCPWRARCLGLRAEWLR